MSRLDGRRNNQRQRFRTETEWAAEANGVGKWWAKSKWGGRRVVNGVGNSARKRENYSRFAAPGSRDRGVDSLSAGGRFCDRCEHHEPGEDRGIFERRCSQFPGCNF